MSDISQAEYKRTKISVAIIARDEADQLPKCLESVKGLDEIVIGVDTRTTDNTKEVALKYTDKVYDLVWEEDFSKARNFVIEKCTGEWVLIIDADEWLEDIDGLRHACKHCPEDVPCIGFDLFSKGRKTSSSGRLIRKDVRYRWIIHEYPNVTKTMFTKHRIHHEKSPSHNLDPDRNLRLLERAVKQDPLPRYKYYLGVEYMQKKIYDKAFETLKEYISVATQTSEKNDAILLMGWILLLYKKYEEAKSCLLEVFFANPYNECAIALLGRMSTRYKDRWEEIRKGADNRDCLFHRKMPDIQRGDSIEKI